MLRRMGSAARLCREHCTCASAPCQALAWLGLGLASLLSGCSVYQSELLDDAAPVTESGSSSGGSSEAPGATGGAGKSGSSGSKAGNGSTSGGTGSPVDEAGGAGEEVGGASNLAGSSGSTTAGSSGSATGAGSGGSAGSGPVSQLGDLLDGFEDQDLVLEQSAGRGGVWYLFDDGSVGTAGPTPLVCSKLSSAPADLGLYAMHVTATGFTGYGSGLGVDFRAGKKPYDASKLSGVRFWARVGEGKNTRHRVQLVDATTDALGGKCNPAANAPEGEKCDDHFGKNLTLTSSWAHYVVPFAELSQIGWGNPAAALDKTTLYGLQLTAKAKLDVDLWLDQIEFF